MVVWWYGGFLYRSTAGVRRKGYPGVSGRREEQGQIVGERRRDEGGLRKKGSRGDGKKKTGSTRGKDGVGDVELRTQKEKGGK